MVTSLRGSLTLLLVKSLKVRYSGDTMGEYVILVDQNDNPIGKEDKVKCHLQTESFTGHLLH